MNISNIYQNTSQFISDHSSSVSLLSEGQKKVAAVAMSVISLIYVLYKTYQLYASYSKDLKFKLDSVRDEIELLRKEVEYLKENASFLPIQLFVKSLDGRTNTIEISLGKSVVSLKKEVEKIDGTPVDQQRLIFAGHQLEDNKRLSDYKISKETTIHLVTRLRGD